MPLGGAKSHDRDSRIEHVTWWTEEMPSEEKIEEGRRNIHHPDIVITHMLSESIDLLKYSSAFGMFLDEVYQNGFGSWYCGHYHMGKMYRVIRLVYQDICKEA